MLIDGTSGSGKTTFLAAKLVDLLASSVPSSEIIVLCQNSHRKARFANIVLDRLCKTDVCAIEDLPIHTFNGIVYNFLNNNWPIIEKELLTEGKSAILPYLSGLEASEYLLGKSIDIVNSDPQHNFQEFRSGLNLKHQLFRRYRLITENGLTPAELKQRSILYNDIFSIPAGKALNHLKRKTTSLRLFDYLKQTNTFMYLLQSNKITNFSNIKYILVDDFDELNYSAQVFVEFIMNGCKEFYIAGDSTGGARCGYLCANPERWSELLKLTSDVKKLESSSLLNEDAEKLFNVIKSENIEVNPNFKNIEFLASSFTWIEMVNNCANRLKDLLCTYQPSDILIVTPTPDKTLINTLENFCELKFSSLTGARKYTEDKFTFALIIISQLANEKWKMRPSAFEIRMLLAKLLGISVTECQNILEFYKKSRRLPESTDFSCAEYNTRYDNLIKLIYHQLPQEEDYTQQLNKIISEFFPAFIDEDSDFSCLNALVHSYSEFKNIFENSGVINSPAVLEKEWLIHSKNTVVTDNIDFINYESQNKICIATPQMAIDSGIKAKVHIWMDVSSYQWIKSDVGPLYNSWVFRKNWGGEQYSLDIHNKLTSAKTAVLLRKLAVSASDKIYCLSSQIDRAGIENQGGFLNSVFKDEIVHIETSFKPREDQKPVLDYKTGTMAVAAVPGAGKTAILQELIIKLINNGTNTDEILVLTYMDSAARNIIQRLKSGAPSMKDYPTVSTIHGLASGIIRDENNAAMLGLSSDFEVCDDFLRTQIIEELCLSSMPAGEESIKDYLRLMATAISRAKYNGISEAKVRSALHSDTHPNMREFFEIYTAYNNRLKSLNLIDFDDMLMLSCRLFEQYPDVLKTYASKYKYVIEDEAQDSSTVQQKLLGMLTSVHKNLIRCGDTNQAITTTFSSADVEGFRRFISSAEKRVEMIGSQRCTEGIYSSANMLINWVQSNKYLKKSFYPLYMKPVEGKNPQSDNPTYFKIYDDFEDEKNFVLSRIKELKKSGNSNKIAILVRSNNKIADWMEILDEAGISYLCFSEKLGQKKVFRFIQRFLEFILNPWDNRIVKNLHNEFVFNGFTKRNSVALDFIDKAGSPLISFSIAEIPDSRLANFLADLKYWLSRTELSYSQLIVAVGNHYFKNLIDRSNVQLMSIMAARFISSVDKTGEFVMTALPNLVEYFRNVGEKNRINSFKFFEEEISDYDCVYLMTVHKSKGLEFDAIFMPDMQESEYSYCVTPENILNIKEKFLIRNIDNFCGINASKSVFAEKVELAQEHMRLIYVGMTRAKKFLHMTSSYSRVNRYGKKEEIAPSVVLQHFASEDSTYEG